MNAVFNNICHKRCLRLTAFESSVMKCHVLCDWQVYNILDWYTENIRYLSCNVDAAVSLWLRTYDYCLHGLFRSRPSSYLGLALGHEGKGSLLSALKRK